MLKLEVKSPDFVVRDGVSKRTGKPYAFRLQTGWLHGVDGYPSKVEIQFGKDEGPFQPGFYVVGPKCFQVDRNLHPIVVLKHAEPAK